LHAFECIARLFAGQIVLIHQIIRRVTAMTAASCADSLARVLAERLAPV
jgi:hypothetical protein